MTDLVFLFTPVFLGWLLFIGILEPLQGIDTVRWPGAL